MSSIARSTLRLAVLLLALLGACSRNRDNADTAAAAGVVADTAAPAVAVTTEVTPGVLMTVEAPAGTGLILVDGGGKAMYVLDAVPTDTTTWRPVNGATPPTSTDARINNSLIGTTTSASGTKQTTYNGKPLYYYSGDSTAADRKGDGVSASGATGHLVNPQGGPTGSRSKGQS